MTFSARSRKSKGRKLGVSVSTDVTAELHRRDVALQAHQLRVGTRVYPAEICDLYKRSPPSWQVTGLSATYGRHRPPTPMDTKRSVSRTALRLAATADTAVKIEDLTPPTNPSGRLLLHGREQLVRLLWLNAQRVE